jgi:acetyl-CoA carboxylase biotin carboxyl carrier protein
VTLTAADVAEIMKLVEESVFDELTLEVDGKKLTLRKSGVAPGADGSVQAATASTLAVAAPQSAAPAPGAAVVAPPKAPTDPNVQDVAAPLLGTFYRSPKPGAPPFVEIGATVQEDTVIAIIEVMKLMNTVRAGVHGTVTEILVNDGGLVEYGQTLLRIRKTS